MIAAIEGDSAAYRRLLEILTPVVRATALQACRRYFAPHSDVEDVVQETLLAIHLKRHTWRTDEPVGPWIHAITRHKLIDSLRRRTRRAEIDIDGLSNELVAAETPEHSSRSDVERLLIKLLPREQSIVRLVSIEGLSMREAGERLDMNDGTVRVALHRALKKLAALLQREST